MAFLAKDRLPLLSLNENEENSLSGYDSPVFVSDTESELPSPAKSSEYSSTGSASEADISSDDDDDGDDLDDIEELDDNVDMTSTDTLVSNIKYILKMPELCDVTFHVGPQLHQVHGLKAVIGSRSKVLQDKIMQQNQQRLRKSKKNENRCSNNNIFINNYDIEVFSKFIDFLHTGSIVMDVTTVVGLTYAAAEFHVPDLTTACLGYLKRCATTVSNIPVLNSEIDNYGNHKITDEIKTVFTEMTKNRKRSPSRKETSV